MRDRQRADCGLGRQRPADLAHKRSTVDVLTSRGVLYSRGESTTRTGSSPIRATGRDWPRRTAGSSWTRTDRGVFSQQAEATLNASPGFRTLAGRAVHIAAGDRQVVVTIQYGPERERVAYDLVVVAIGFRARWFEDPARPRRRGPGSAPPRWTAPSWTGGIDVDLSVTGLDPPLHLPVLAGLAQGPGFPNLSCLGLLSDRVLLGMFRCRSPPAIAAERSEHV